MEAWKEELYLQHHGILGQKWGKRNGPPYPLNPEDHSTAEKKAAQNKRKGLTDTQKKKLIKAGVYAVGTALVAIGAYKFATNPSVRSLVSKGMTAIKGNPDINKIIDEMGPEIVLKSDIANQPFDATSNLVPKDVSNYFGQYEKSISPDDVLGKVGSENTLQHDCGPTGLALLENQNSGLKLKAKDIDHGISPEEVKKLYPTTDYHFLQSANDLDIIIDNPEKYTHQHTIKNLKGYTKDGDNGLIGIKKYDYLINEGAENNKSVGHWITYSNENGHIILRDGTVKTNINGQSIKGLKYCLDSGNEFAELGGMRITGDKAKEFLKRTLSVTYDPTKSIYMPIKGHKIIDDLNVLKEYFDPL